jgi:hypothetical protein
LAKEDFDWRHREITLREKVQLRFERLLFRDKFRFDKEIFEKIDLGDMNVL